MSGQPWETHDRLCPNRRPTVAFPNSACSGCRAVVAARAEGYARGLIEGDHGGRREGYRSGYAAGKDAVMTASYAQAVAEGQRDEREAANLRWQAAMDEYGEKCQEIERERIRTGMLAVMTENLAEGRISINATREIAAVIDGDTTKETT